MTDQDVLSVGFTEVLYGVVVANAIYELTFAVELRNVLLLLAFTPSFPRGGVYRKRRYKQIQNESTGTD